MQNAWFIYTTLNEAGQDGTFMATGLGIANEGEYLSDKVYGKEDYWQRFAVGDDKLFPPHEGLLFFGRMLQELQRLQQVHEEYSNRDYAILMDDPNFDQIDEDLDYYTNLAEYLNIYDLMESDLNEIIKLLTKAQEKDAQWNLSIMVDI